jgi:hypothetical protein
MKTDRLRLLPSTIAVLLLGSVIASADTMTYTFSTDPPSGNIQGTAGSTIGWGYSIMNKDLTDWLVTTTLASDPFGNGIPNASLFDFPIVAPGDRVEPQLCPGAEHLLLIGTRASGVTHCS